MIHKPAMGRLLLGAVLCALSALLVFRNLGAIGANVFDELAYIPAAQRYLAGVFYQDAHPPLARLLIAAGQALFFPGVPSDQFAYVFQIRAPWPAGVQIVGYRIFPAILGALLPLLAFAIGRVLLRRDDLAFILGAAVLLDNALVVYSRLALPETTLLFFFLVFLLAFFVLLERLPHPAHSPRGWWLLLGGALSAAGLVKLNALPLGILVPVYLALLLRRQGGRRALQALAWIVMAFLAVFLTVWFIHFSLIGLPSAAYPQPVLPEVLSAQSGAVPAGPIKLFFLEVYDAYYYIFTYHRGIGMEGNDPFHLTSPWYWWPLGGKAMPLYYYAYPDGTASLMALLGNPLVWLASLAGVIGGILVAIRNLLRPARAFSPEVVNSLALSYVAYMFSMASVGRLMYLYHYLPALLIGLILFFVLMQPLWEKMRGSRSAVTTLIVLTLAFAFLYYAPFTYYTRFTPADFAARNIWPAWQLQWPENP